MAENNRNELAVGKIVNTHVLTHYAFRDGHLYHDDTLVYVSTIGTDAQKILFSFVAGADCGEGVGGGKVQSREV